MRRSLYYVALASVVVVCTARSEWISLRNSASQASAPRVTLLQDDLSGTVLKIEVSGFEVNDLVSGSHPYKSVDLLTDAFTTEVGFPELPCVTKILAVPDRAAVSVEVLETGEEFAFGGYVLPPARRPWIEGEPETPYVEREDAYQSVSAYPREGTVVDAPSVFRDFRIVRVAVYPVKYIAARNEIRVASSMTIRVKYGIGEVVNPKTSPRKPIAPSFAALYRSSIFNYQGALDRQFAGLETGRDVLVCIVPDAFADSLKPFANWRHKTGTFVKVTKFSEIGATATNPDSIKNYLARIYHNWKYPPSYVLLAGDNGYIPIKQIVYDYTIVSEDFYVEIDGNDFLPEMMIGRFTHESVATEQNIVRKIIGYERNPYTGNTSWFKKGAVVADMEYPSMLATKRFARDCMMLDGAFTAVDTFMSHSPCYSTLSSVTSAIDNGRSFLNYRGQGWYTGWSPNGNCYSFQTTNVQSLNNGRMLTFVTSIGCGVGAFNQSSCFGEQWLELGTVAAPRGAVTFIGPTSNTHTPYNNLIDKGIYIGMFQEGLETPGQALARGRLYMYQAFGNEHWVEYQTRVYCILGDPTVHIWKDVPRPVTVAHPSSVPVGYNQVAFTVTDSATGAPVGAAQVCLAGDSIYVTGYTDLLGKVILAITPEFVDTLSVLVRGGNVVPYEGSSRITSETEHVAPLGEPVVVDLDGNLDGLINPNEHGQITFTLKNWGTQTASNVQATLNVDTNKVQLQTTTPVNFGNLSSGGSLTGSPFQFFVKPGCTVGENIAFNLHVASALQTWDYIQLEELMGCRLKCGMYIVDDRGAARTNARMDPGETVKLYLTLKNVGEDIAPGIQATLRCTSPYITIGDSLSTFGTLSADSSFTNFNDYFVVRVDSACPARTVIPYSLFLQTQGGRYAYSYVDTFSIPVSIPKQSDPTGPDSYGYYAYASDDTLFQQSPRYNWVELNGVGTQVTVPSSGNYTTTVTLPFTFKYYGVNYTQVRLSSDGWIAFGSGTQTAYNAVCLPYNDNVGCMVAAFWDNLFMTTGETGKLLYYSAPAQRFIVEWYNVGHNNTHTGADNKETFQIILYDPATYPTPTGDGEILFQYKNTAYTAENTVGIENSTQTVALQYVCTDQPDIDPSATPLRDTLAILFTTQAPQLLVGVDGRGTKGEAIPTQFVLEQNYPNPFNPQTTISYSLPANSQVSLKIFSVTGQLVRTLQNGENSAGKHVVQWDGLNDRGNSVGSGVYFYRLQATPANGAFTVFVQTKKLLMLR
ncbi:MAG TPA: hypothetical protein DGH68_05535 [Bacteroidetes bacterium]|jgi:hypothetical protein|nr:hypothetical protein [Bacteroidota bacterium]